MKLLSPEEPPKAGTVQAAEQQQILALTALPQTPLVPRVPLRMW